MSVSPFSISVPTAALDDLRDRLARARWPSTIPGAQWVYGVDMDYLRDLVAYWRTTYDWRTVEGRLNGVRQVMVDVDGVQVHCVWERGVGPRPLPLLLTHGWPGSFLEFMRVLPLLKDPEAHGGRNEDAFDVVIPSLPGFGFSEHPAVSGTDVRRIADLWAGLMTALGYDRFGGQGGDFGAGVCTALGLRHPERIIGLHLNYIPGSYSPPPDLARPPNETERMFLQASARWYDEEGGYAHVQATKPDMLSVALNDSPIGLLAWIVEKFRAWGDCDGHVESRFSRDDLLTNVTLYWVTGSIASANRLYVETRERPLRFAAGDRVSVPCGVARFPREEPFPPRSWVERGYQVRHWSEMSSGGHFPALEEPAALVDDIRRFFRPLRG